MKWKARRIERNARREVKGQGSQEERIRDMVTKIERRGGIVGLSPNTPDWLKEQFLREVLDCPDCKHESRIEH
jgi:hypothetical protein